MKAESIKVPSFLAVPSFEIKPEYDWIPLISKLSGIARVAFGCIQLYHAYFRKKQDSSENDSQKALNNIYRGAIAMTPIAGNIALYLLDTNRIKEESLTFTFNMALIATYCFNPQTWTEVSKVLADFN